MSVHLAHLTNMKSDSLLYPQQDVGHSSLHPYIPQMQFVQAYTLEMPLPTISYTAFVTSDPHRNNHFLWYSMW